MAERVKGSDHVLKLRELMVVVEKHVARSRAQELMLSSLRRFGYALPRDPFEVRSFVRGILFAELTRYLEMPVLRDLHWDLERAMAAHYPVEAVLTRRTSFNESLRD